MIVYVKIGSLPSSDDLHPPLRMGAFLRWHYTSFEALMTERPRMLETSYSKTVREGYAGYPRAGIDSDWVMTVYSQLRLGEKSIWTNGETFAFVEVIQCQLSPKFELATGTNYSKCTSLIEDVNTFKTAVMEELKDLPEGANKARDVELANWEVDDFACASFKDHWTGTDSAITSSHGTILELSTRRLFTQGLSALALNGLGCVVREFEAKSREQAVIKHLNSCY